MTTIEGEEGETIEFVPIQLLSVQNTTHGKGSGNL